MDVWEDSELFLYAGLKEGEYDKLKEKKVTFSFKLSGGQSTIADKTVDIAADQKTASCKVKFPLVKDDEDNYEVRYTTAAGGKKVSGKEVYVVWPKDFELKARHKVDGSEVDCKDFSFQIGVNGIVAPADAALTTDATGLHNYQCTQKAIHEITPVSPWLVDKWKKKKGRKREALVSRKRYTAEIVFAPRGGKEHKQYVNLAVVVGTDAGSRIKLTVWAKGDAPKLPADRLGLQGDNLYLKVIFGDKNSARNSPKPRLIVGGLDVAAEADGRTYLKTLQLAAGGEGPEFEVELGYASADVCEIKAGVTDACGDDSFKITNWKKLKMVMIQPDATVSGFTVFKADGTAGLAQDQLDAFRKALDKMCIRFEDPVTIPYGAADVGVSRAWRIHDGAYFKKTAGKKIFTCTFDLSGALRAAKGPAVQDANSFITCWSDFLLDVPRVGQYYPHPVTTRMDSASKSYRVADEIGLYQYDPTQDVQTLGIDSLTWKCVQYKSGLSWRDITAATDPGFAKSADQAVPIDWANHLQHYLEFTNYREVKIKLPARATEPDDPGHFLQVAGKKVKIQVDITFRAAFAGANAGGWHGFIDMSTMAGKFQTGGLVSTLVHELGHNMAQAYAPKAVDAEFGSTAANEIPGVPFPAGVAAGFVYGEHGHTGTHCAFGLSDTLRRDASFRGKKYTSAAKCVMFGAGDMNDSKLLEFCEKCAPFVKAVDASDLTKQWES